jgi:hypothetical protein
MRSAVSARFATCVIVGVTSVFGRTLSSREHDELVEHDDADDCDCAFLRKDTDCRRRREREKPRKPRRARSVARAEISE